MCGSRQVQTCQRRWFKIGWRRLAIAALTTTIVTASHPAAGQVPNIIRNQLPIVNRLIPSPSNNGTTIGQVYLDGERLFPIALPIADRIDPIAQRVDGIETQLKQIVRSKPTKISVKSTIDEKTSLPIVTVNERYLMTVTTLDAELQGTSPERWGNSITQILTQALNRALAERQPQFLLQQTLSSGGILLAMTIFSTIVSRWQRYFQTQEAMHAAAIPDLSQERSTATDPFDVETSARVKQQLSQTQQRNLSEIKRRLLQLVQIALWTGSVYIIFGLFPDTRGWQFIIFSTPLRLLGICLMAYLFSRISAIVVDRLFAIVQQEQLAVLDTSQRLALRTATFSSVVKSILAIFWFSSAILLCLSSIGVDLLPLLTGAGIIGLGISFAAQSVIKDMINGFFILLEDWFAVGDVITIGNVSGVVENINLRITQVRNDEGSLITIPNSKIDIAHNRSKDWSRVNLMIQLADTTDIDCALAVLTQLTTELYDDVKWRSQLLEPPQVLGIDEIAYTGVSIGIRLKTLPLKQADVAREFRRRLKIAIEQEQLQIGIPQQSLRFPPTVDPFSKIPPDRLPPEPIID